MIKSIINKIRQIRKVSSFNFLYRFQMSPAKHVKGRKLFDAEELKLVHQTLLSQNLFGIDGRMVPAFEEEFAKAYNFPYAVASTSGTSAIHTALAALDLNPGDEVITAPITDMGTIIPILCQQAVPVFADIDQTYNMSPAQVERCITPKTKAIIVVHLFGNPCDMDAMLEVAKKHNIPLIEDCSQAHMTQYKGRYVGTIGDIGCFSFQQSKHMTTGDGGMTITSNRNYYEKMKLYVDKGFARKGWGPRAYLFLGMNYRMNELTAAVGLAQLKKVKTVVETRHALGEQLTASLAGITGLRTAPVTSGGSHSYWLYPLYFNDIDLANRCVAEMKRQGLSASIGYTVKPIYLCSESLTAKKTFGQSQLPFHPSITNKIYEYKEGLCPQAEEALKHLVCINLNESWSKEKICKAADVIRSVVGKDVSTETSVSLSATSESPSALSSEAEEASQKIRIGIIGCGQMGRWHLNAYKQNPDVKIVAFADSDVSKAEAFAKEENGSFYADYLQMIKNENLDGVSLCTVPASHYSIVIDLLNAGINILCEKPLAVSAEQAQAMICLAKEKNKILLPAFKFRFFEEVQSAKKILDQGGLGKILNFRLMFGGYINMKETWYANKEISGGGVIMDNGPHAVDLIRYLLGDIEKITAEASYCQNLSVEDTAHLICILEKRIKGFVDLSWTTSVPANAYLEIYGENGCLLLDNKGLSYKFNTWQEFERIQNATNSKAAFNRQINHFVDGLAGQEPSIVKMDDGYKAQTLIEMAYHSLNYKTTHAVKN